MSPPRKWDPVAIMALGVSLLTIAGYVCMMYPDDLPLGNAWGVGILLSPLAFLYAAWGAYRSVSNRDLRGGWMAWLACGMLFLALTDFLRHLGR
jgi:hypothetical protein